MMKRAIVLAVLLLIPSFAWAAATTEQDKTAPQAAEPPQEASVVVDLGAFSASDATGLGAVTATVVTSPGDKGRAEAALSRALSRARVFAVEIPALEEKLNTLAKGEKIELSPDAFAFMAKVKALAAQTNGWFDPTAPSPKSSFLKKDWRRIHLDSMSRTLWLRSDGMKFDLRRVAAGFAADMIMDELTQSGFVNAAAEVGAVQRNIGHNIFTPWNVTIGFGEGPTQTGTYRAYTYNVKDVGAATVTPDGLGNNLIDAQNKKHVAPDGVRSITVFAHDAVTATAFAIAAYTLGPKHGLRYIESHPEMMCVIVDNGGTLMASKNMNITHAPERAAVKQAQEGGSNDLKQKQREESVD
jgi:thiamine biosynthesis lipoprotein ApbE